MNSSNPNHYRIRAERILARQQITAVVVFLFLGNDIVCSRVDSFPPRPSAIQRGLTWLEEPIWRAWIDAVVHPLYIHDFA